jgi:hypothetical protein
MSEPIVTMRDRGPKAGLLEAWGQQGLLLSGTVDMSTRQLIELRIEDRPEALRELFALLAALSGHVQAEMERQHKSDPDAWRGGQGA